MLILDQKTEQQSERGAALLLTIMLMLVLSLLTVSLYELLQTSTQITGNHRLETRTLYVADAGVEDAIKNLRNDDVLRKKVDDPGETVLLFDDESFAGGTYTVKVDYAPVSNLAIAYEMDITSTGTVSGFKRAIEVHIRLIENDLGEYSVATTSWELIPPPSS